MIDIHLHKKLLPEFSTNKVKVFEVNPTGVTFGNIKFCNAGHHLVYPETIPQGEVWISRDMSHIEKLYYIFHELFEHRKMLMGVPYEQAHAWSNMVEGRERHQLDEHELRGLIKKEMQRNKEMITEASHYNGQLSLRQDTQKHHSFHLNHPRSEGIRKNTKRLVSVK